MADDAAPCDQNRDFRLSRAMQNRLRAAQVALSGVAGKLHIEADILARRSAELPNDVIATEYGQELNRWVRALICVQGRLAEAERELVTLDLCPPTRPEG